MDDRDSCPVSWRQRDVLSILQGPDNQCKDRLRRFRPFNNAFLYAAEIDLPESKCSTFNGITLRDPLQGEHSHVSYIAHQHIQYGRSIFLKVPFSAWVQMSLEIKSPHIDILRENLATLSSVVFQTMSCDYEKARFYREELVCHSLL